MISNGAYIKFSIAFLLLLSMIAGADAKFIFRYASGHVSGERFPNTGFSVGINGIRPFTTGQMWMANVDVIGKPEGKLSYTMLSGPGWLNIDSNTGAIMGLPPASGDYGNALVVVTDGITSRDLRFVVSVGDPLLIQELSDILLFSDAELERNIVAEGGVAPYRFEWDEESKQKAPAWVTLSSETGEMSGVSEEGEWDLGILVTDRDGRVATMNIRIEVAKGTNWASYMGAGEVRGVALGTVGEIYVSGTLKSGGDRLFFARIDDEGSVDWIKSVQSSGKGSGIVARGGSVYVSGTISVGGENKIFVAKFSQYGIQEWGRAIGATGSQYGEGIAVDGNGAVIVVGSGYSISKLSSSGSHLWTKNFGGMGNDARAVAADGFGNIYVGGMTYNGGNGQGDVLIAKLDSDGNKIWAKTMGGPGMEYINSLSMGADGAIYGSGYTTHAGDNDILAIKLETDGQISWMKRIGINPGQEMGYQIVSTSNGVYLAAEATVGRSTDHEAVFLHMTSSGTIVRARRFGGVLTERGYGIAAVSSGTVFLGGISTSYFDKGNVARAMIARFSSSLAPSSELPEDNQYEDILNFSNSNVPFSVSDRSSWAIYDGNWNNYSLNGIGINNEDVSIERINF